MKQIRKRVTYANVMSSIAVFLVLGGGAALAAGLAKNSVGSKQLKKNAVKTAKIADNAVNGAKIGDNAVTTSELADAAVTLAELADNSVTNPKLADNAVNSAELTAAAVTLAKLAGNSVDATKVLDDSLGAADLAPNSVGSSEITAAAVGANELGDRIHEHTASGNVTDGTALDGNWIETSVITASCAAGEELIGVASTWTAGGDELSTQQLNPNFSAESVAGVGISDDGGTATFQVTAVCSN
ncbi:MAG TPA: hypothetical protein VIS95_04995 [Solirubrobacterales bacterium]